MARVVLDCASPSPLWALGKGFLKEAETWDEDAQVGGRSAGAGA